MDQYIKGLMNRKQKGQQLAALGTFNGYSGTNGPASAPSIAGSQIRTFNAPGGYPYTVNYGPVGANAQAAGHPGIPGAEIQTGGNEYNNPAAMNSILGDWQNRPEYQGWNTVPIGNPGLKNPSQNPYDYIQGVGDTSVPPNGGKGIQGSNDFNASVNALNQNARPAFPAWFGQATSMGNNRRAIALKQQMAQKMA